MKKALLLLVLLVLVAQITPVLSQTLADVVKEERGDTLVIKTQADMLGEANALYIAIKADTLNVPAGRVYLLQAGGVYNNQNNPSFYANRTTKLIGSDPTRLVVNKNALASLPLIVGNVGTTTNNGGLGGAGNCIIENVALTPSADDGSFGWAFHGSGAADQVIQYKNCLFERTRWIEVAAFNANVTFKLSDCYFVNLNGQPCRRNGGVYDGFAKLDTFLVENCTHIMTQGMMYKWRNYTANRIIMNHNTFVNCSGIQFMDLGTQANVSYTNNLFVNVNVQPFPAIASIDDGEKDIDMLPMGLVNVYPDSALAANNVVRKFLVEANCVYWDPYIANIADTANTIQLNGRTTWVSQMIKMNSRTQGFFNDNTAYPRLTEGVWYSEKPLFTDSKDLFGAQLVALKTFSLATVDTASTAVLPDWRLINTGAANFVFFDWPIPVDLSYSNAKLKTGATNGFPVGDLNWFPTEKAAWLAQRTAEYTAIQTALDNGTTTVGVSKPGINSPVSFKLDQNYPNPFNPTTKISFTLAKSGYTNLKVIDIVGREVATLVNGFTPAGSQEVEFNATNLASGVYFYKLTSGNLSEVKKMMLVK